jgi:hypothetical protein
MDEGQDHHHSCHLGDLCQSLKLITQHQRSFAQFMTSRRKSVLTQIFIYIESDIIQWTGCRI